MRASKVNLSGWQGTLKKISSNIENLRSDEIVGVFAEWPTIGMPFVIVSDSLTFVGGGRFIKTTQVKAIRALDNGLEFDTQNSTYQITTMEKQE
jgi:hypothetical protein